MGLNTMRIKSIPFGAGKLVAFYFFLVGVCPAEPITVSGKAILEGGNPIVGGMIRVQRIVPADTPDGLPALREAATTATDTQGAFTLVVDNLDAPFMVRLERKKCSYRAHAEEIFEIPKSKTLTLIFSIVAETCSK